MVCIITWLKVSTSREQCSRMSTVHNCLIVITICKMFLFRNFSDVPSLKCVFHILILRFLFESHCCQSFGCFLTGFSYSGHYPSSTCVCGKRHLHEVITLHESFRWQKCLIWLQLRTVAIQSLSGILLVEGTGDKQQRGGVRLAVGVE